jgi:two-component system cell cycle response regulator
MDLVIRYGGEEFLILLVDCKVNEAIGMGERIRSAVEAYEFRIPGGTIRKTISIGVEEFPGKEGQDIRDAIKEADKALYRAKKDGRNQIVQLNTNLNTAVFQRGRHHTLSPNSYFSQLPVMDGAEHD